MSSQLQYPPIALASGSSKTVIERANGYSSGGSKVYDATRAYNATMQLNGSGYGAIVRYPSDDVAPSKTFTQITAPSNGTFPNNLTDHDDSTAVAWSYNNVTYDLFSVDLKSSLYGFLRIYITNQSNATLTVYVSNDSSTWTSISPGSSTLGEQIYFINGYRYIKFTVAFGSSGTISFNSVEFFTATASPFNTSLTYNGILKVYAQGYYQLLEVISL